MENTSNLYLVVPCYNEEQVLTEASKRLLEKLKNMKKKNMVSKMSRIMFVDDGSKDTTWEIISGLHELDPTFSGLKLSRP